MEQSGRMFQNVPGGKNNMMERGWNLNQEVVRNHDEAREKEPEEWPVGWGLEAWRTVRG